MLEQILDLVKQNSQQSVVENPQIPNENNAAIMAEAASTITGGLQNILSGGGLQSIIAMFSGGQNQGQQNILSNPVVSMMIGHLAGNLVKKFNLNPAIANGIANNIIPNVINHLVSNTQSNEPANDSFDLNDLIASFTGGNANADNTNTNGFDFQRLINQFTANGDAGGSSLDFNNIISTVTQRAQQQQQEQGGGGLAQLIQGFFR